jgi:hypothetical protein
MAAHPLGFRMVPYALKRTLASKRGSGMVTNGHQSAGSFLLPTGSGGNEDKGGCFFWRTRLLP